MCNSDLTPEILEKAIMDEASAKPKGGMGIFGGGSP